MRIVIDCPFPADCEAALRAAAPGMTLVRLPKFHEPIAAEVLRDADVLYTEAGQADPALAPRLRFVQHNCAATQPLRGSPLMKSRVPIASVTGAYSVAVAECAMGMLLAMTRKIVKAVQDQPARQFPDTLPAFMPWAGVDLYGMTMGIMGYGSIGRQIGRVASGMGMKILACKRQPEVRRDDSYVLPGTGDAEGKLPAGWFGVKDLPAMLRQSQVLMIAAPGIPTTTGLVGGAELDLLPRGAFLVNVGRGSILEEAALPARLASGHLAGAALDVFEREPLPAESPLWSAPNLLVMPHIASWTVHQAHRAAGVLIENVRRSVAGEPLLNLIDKELLY